MKSLAAIAVLLPICAACSTDESSPLEDATNPSPEAGTTAPGLGGCQAGLRDCVDGGAVECVNGEWVAQARCEFPKPHCAAGRCIECLRGEVACAAANTVLRCDEAGAWQAALACSGSLPVCLDGRCVECLPGRNLCDGRRPVVCRADGTYASQTPCKSGTRCAFGECVPDQPPAVRILEPADGSLFRVKQANHTSVEIAVHGEALDPEDIEVADLHLSWSTDRIDLQGGARILARGSTAPAWLNVPTPCQETRHQLTLTAVDSASNQGRATITVVVGCYVEP
ncbi:MAG TPA: hypothetical protein VK524_12810 [Polyangiaceae bacterium]|nr:hypothetical protein [Polyangiaceae bacterium]